MSKKNINTRHTQGVIIGQIFKNVILENLSIQQAAQKFFDYDAPTIQNSPNSQTVKFPEDPKHLSANLWPKYKDSAHLWGIYSFCGKAKKPTRWLPVDNFGLNEFILAAEDYLKKGLKQMAVTGPRTPVLNSKTAWRIKA